MIKAEQKCQQVKLGKIRDGAKITQYTVCIEKKNPTKVIWVLHAPEVCCKEWQGSHQCLHSAL